MLTNTQVVTVSGNELLLKYLISLSKTTIRSDNCERNNGENIFPWGCVYIFDLFLVLNSSRFVINSFCSIAILLQQTFLVAEIYGPSITNLLKNI